jgi:hypothetical protein
VVGEEHINFPGGGVSVNDSPQGFGALPGFGPGQQDGHIGHHPRGGIDGPLLQNSVADIALLAGDKEDFGGRELPYQA